MDNDVKLKILHHFKARQFPVIRERLQKWGEVREKDEKYRAQA